MKGMIKGGMGKKSNRRTITDLVIMVHHCS